MTATAVTAMPVAAGPMWDMAAVERLSDALLASPTATAVLEQRCAALCLADPPSVRSEVVRGVALDPGPSTMARLDLRKGERIAFRRVRLMCGAHVLSEADNWYVEDRLTAAMLHELAHRDTPFGRVLLPLGPHRRTLARDLRDPAAPGAVDEVLRLHALVMDGTGRPLAEVVERYRRVLLDQPSGGVSAPASRSPSS